MKYSSKIMSRMAGGLIVAGLLAATRVGAADTTLSSKGSSFIKEASEGNQAEIATAQLAQEKSQNPEVKSLAQMIQNDHQQAQEKLQTIAQTHGVALDQTPTFSQRRERSKLEKLSGADFDQQYTKAMLEDHVKDIKKFQKASENLEDADVKQYAQETLPKLQEHLEHAKAAAKAVGVEESTISSITKDLPAMGGTGVNQQRGQGAGRGEPY
jgi:putative membrane protein